MKKLLPLLLSLISMSAFAADREFDVEVIIFKRAVAPENVNESWPDTLPEKDLSRVGYLNNSAYLESKGVTLLPPGALELNEQADALKRHAGFEVLMHTAWRQGDQPKSGAPAFHLRAGRDYSQRFNPDGSQKGAEPVVSALEQEVTIDKPIFELDGKFQVYVQHYLFLETTLDLKAPATREVVMKPAQPEMTLDQSAVDTPALVQDESTVQFGNLESISPTFEVEEFLKSYRMSQKRRMRSGEVHYLDHPLMGIVIQVRKAPVIEAG
jgi:hypothetical protein